MATVLHHMMMTMVMMIMIMMMQWILNAATVTWRG